MVRQGLTINLSPAKKYLKVSQLAIFLFDRLFQEKCVRQELVPGDKKVLIWSLFLSALLLNLTACFLFPVREYQHLTCLVFKGESCVPRHRYTDLTAIWNHMSDETVAGSGP